MWPQKPFSSAHCYGLNSWVTSWCDWLHPSQKSHSDCATQWGPKAKNITILWLLVEIKLSKPDQTYWVRILEEGQTQGPGYPQTFRRLWSPLKFTSSCTQILEACFIAQSLWRVFVKSVLFSYPRAAFAIPTGGCEVPFSTNRLHTGNGACWTVENMATRGHQWSPNRHTSPSLELIWFSPSLFLFLSSKTNSCRDKFLQRKL